jgi:hypothetical protein
MSGGGRIFVLVLIAALASLRLAPSQLSVRAQQGELTVTPSSGPVGTTVALEGTGCGYSGQPVYLVFGGGEGEVTGTVGADDIPNISVGTDGSFKKTYTIPSQIHDLQGSGGGAVVPGIYRFFSKPPLCRADFTVTASGLPPTGSAPASGQSGSAPLWALVSIAGAVAALLGGGLLARLRPRLP